MDKQIDVLVRKFYSVADLAHISHVNTRSFAAHEALGEFYGKITEVKDRLIEYLMGEGKLMKVNAGILEIGEDISKEASGLAELFCNWAKMCDEEALINLSGEFEEAVGKLKFLLMLK
jgi:hypothetical protein